MLGQITGQYQQYAAPLYAAREQMYLTEEKLIQQVPSVSPGERIRRMGHEKEVQRIPVHL